MEADRKLQLYPPGIFCSGIRTLTTHKCGITIKKYDA